MSATMTDEYSDWSKGILKDLNDFSKWILFDQNVVVVADKFPKAQFHYLVLPRKNIPSIFELTRDDLHLLGQMYSMALNVIRFKGCQRDDFKIGYHAEPSMQHLHMHVISTDFNSPTLRTQRHWNSFHTKLFIPHQELIARIVEEGEIIRLDYRIIDQLRQTPLKCHRCSARLNKISNLKWHLRTYHSER